MSFSIRSASPDPITLPSSPLGTRSGNARPQRRLSAKPRAPRSSTSAHPGSPSKSVIMDTGPAGDASPWRIKVTVEAEPRDSRSPAKKVARTTTVPLKGGSSSPAKNRNPRRRTLPEDETDEEMNQSKRPQRRRKGTPIRRRATKTQPAMEDLIADAEEAVHTTHSPKQLAPTTNRSNIPDSTERSKRLNQAREQLDSALQDAMAISSVTYQDQENVDPNPTLDDGGDMTMANEDFTMVSVETLRSMKQNTSQLFDQSALALGDKSVASVSYMPSSPPISQNGEDAKIGRSEIAPNTSAAKGLRTSDVSLVEKQTTTQSIQYEARKGTPTAPSPSTHDALSTQGSQAASMSQSSPDGAAAVTGATSQDAIVIEDSAHAGAEESDDEQDQTVADIWAEEASRSLEEAEEESRTSNGASELRQLFGGEPPKPPRPKIPRTWRRSSGIEFNYADSPANGALRKASAFFTDGEGVESRSDGVLTPPSTDDEASNLKVGEEDELEEGDTSFTEPEAQATPLPVLNRALSPPVRSPSPQSDSSTTPDGDGGDTGMFWQTNLPNVYPRRTRPKFKRQQQAMDLSELLNLHNKSSSPAKAQPARAPALSMVASCSTARRRNLQAEKQAVRIPLLAPTTSGEKVMSSPLRLSLLKSSKIGGSVLLDNNQLRNSTNELRSLQQRIAHQVDQSTLPETQSVCDSTMNSFESQASDQRQLLEEMHRASSGSDNAHIHGNGYTMNSEMQSGYDEDEHTVSDYPLDNRNGERSEMQYEESDMSNEHTEDPTRSYEEHLNLDSPQKIQVKFNDSDGNSSLLAPRKEYPPILGNRNSVVPEIQTRQACESTPTHALVSEKTTDAAVHNAPGFFSRLSASLWSAIVRPSGPAEILPQEQHADPVYCPDLRRHIRSRYGVLSDQHPWTMAHMRTLHRLLNSTVSGKIDSIVPKTGPLPSELAELINYDLLCIGEFFSCTFTEQHAHVVDAFMQTLVPEHIAQAIKDGEMDFLGDSFAKECRGLIAGRHGDRIGFQNVEEQFGPIERDFVVQSLINCVFANIGTAQREKEEREAMASK